LQTSIVFRMFQRACLGRLARALAYLSFWDLIPCRCELGLDEAEPNVRFLLIVGTKFDLSSCCRSDRVGQIIRSHGGKFRESRQSPKFCGALFPRRLKYGSHGRAKRCTK
jgi:hypothetical protein